MTRTNAAKLDRLRPAEKAIYQRVRPYLGRSDLESLVARIRQAHPVWSDIYNLTPDRVLEVLERLGLESELLPAPSGPPADPGPAADPAANPAEGDAPARPSRSRRGTRHNKTLPFDTSWLERSGRGVTAPSPAQSNSQPPAAPQAQPTPAPAAVRPDADPAPPRPERTERSARRKHTMEQPVETRENPAPSSNTAPPVETGDAAPRKPRPAAKKRPAGSVDELLQQIDLVASDISDEEATIEQANRRIADLERRRQALCDQLALTLRSRVPVEILRLAAADSPKSGEKPAAERRRSSG